MNWPTNFKVCGKNGFSRGDREDVSERETFSRKASAHRKQLDETHNVPPCL